MSDSRVQVGVKKLPMHLQSSQNRLLIKGGKIVNDDRMFVADIYVEDGVIRQVGTQLSIPGGVRVIEAAGKMVIPGGVDANTCFEMPSMGTQSSDDFYSGTKAALSGGTTTIIDCVLPCRNMSLIEAYENCRQLADSKVCCDYALHVIVPCFNAKVAKDMETLVKEKGINSFRVHLSDSNEYSVEDSDIFDIFHQCRELGAIAQVHAVNGKLVKILGSKLYEKGITGPEGFLYSHPEAAEVEATNRAIAIADATCCPLYVLQVMSPRVASQISEARLKGDIIVGETIAAALGTDGSHYKNKCWRHAAAYVVCPPLRPESTTPGELMRYISNGVLDCCSSAHCVFKAEQKALGKDDFRKIPPGVNGVEDRLTVIWEKGVVSGIIDPCKFVAATSTNAAKVFNLYPRKGRIDVGSDADLVIWDGETTRIISTASHHQNVDFNIFDGMHCHGVPTMVITAGRVVLENGDLRVTQGVGRYLNSAPFSPHIYERVKRCVVSRTAKSVIRDPYDGPVTNESNTSHNDAHYTNGMVKPDSDGDSLRVRPPTCGGGRNMQESSFSLSGAQYDDTRPIRTGIRTKQPPGGASNALW